LLVTAVGFCDADRSISLPDLCKFIITAPQYSSIRTSLNWLLLLESFLLLVLNANRVSVCKSAHKDKTHVSLAKPYTALNNLMKVAYSTSGFSHDSDDGAYCSML